MYTKLPESSGAFVALQVSGKLEKDGYESFLPELTARIKEHGKISLFWEMVGFSGWTVRVIWSDGSFDVKHANDSLRVAIVGDKKWHEWMTSAMRPFTSVDVRYFNREERDEALYLSKDNLIAAR
jgi:hypothetical protein